MYKSTYEFIKENLDIDDSELEEIHVDVKFLKEEKQFLIHSKS